MDEDEIFKIEKVSEDVIIEYQEFSSDDEFDFQFLVDDKEYNSILKELNARESESDEFDDSTKGNSVKIECPFKDKGCKRSFVRKTNLLKHLEEHDSGTGLSNKDRPICHICGKKVLGNYSFHVRNHEAIKRFGCDLCGRKFKQKISLSYHLLIHGDEKPHECPYCSRRFRQKYTMKAHIKTRHIGIKEYICELCGKEFGDKSTIQKHFLVHSTSLAHQCKVCFMTFRHKSSLSRHRRIHQKVTQCGYCNRTFRYESFLKKHILTAHKGFDVEEGMNVKFEPEVITVIQDISTGIVSKVHPEAQFIEVDPSSQFYSQTVTINCIEEQV